MPFGPSYDGAVALAVIVDGTIMFHVVRMPVDDVDTLAELDDDDDPPNDDGDQTKMDSVVAFDYVMSNYDWRYAMLVVAYYCHSSHSSI